MSLGQVLRTARQDRGWLLDDVARRTGLSRGYISRLERDLAQPTKATLGQLGRTFRLSFEYLLFCTGRLPDDICHLSLTAQDVAKLYKELRRNHG